MGRFIVLLILAMVTGSMPAVSGDAGGQNDADSGRDAPEAWEDALDVTASSFEGMHDQAQGDKFDWYRLMVPAGKGLRVTLTAGTANFSTLRALTDEGKNLSYSKDFGWKYAQTLSIPQGLAAVRVGVIAHEDAGTYRIAVTAVDPRPQTDAGYADDAPDNRDEAFELHAPGTYSGELRPSQADGEDWYRMVVPPGKVLRAVLVPAEGDFWLRSVNDVGQPVERSTHPGAGVVEIVEAVDRFSGGVRIGVLLSAGEGPYTLDLQFHDAPDLRVTALTVGSPQAPPDQRRLVTATIENKGGPADNTYLFVWARFATTDRLIGSTVRSIAPNQTVNVTFAWDTTGQMGEAKLTACMQSAVDTSFADNERHARTRLHAPLPVGVDATSSFRDLVVGWGFIGYCSSGQVPMGPTFAPWADDADDQYGEIHFPQGKTQYLPPGTCRDPKSDIVHVDVLKNETHLTYSLVVHDGRSEGHCESFRLGSMKSQSFRTSSSEVGGKWGVSFTVVLGEHPWTRGTITHGPGLRASYDLPSSAWSWTPDTSTLTVSLPLTDTRVFNDGLRRTVDLRGHTYELTWDSSALYDLESASRGSGSVYFSDSWNNFDQYHML